ncbi:MAG: DUF4097 family beta strand repeat protein [Gemmatimonadetes bacterium]|nr:DUF4097 family beta strand repeat protein [Gemmatimonadota bacterium]
MTTMSRPFLAMVAAAALVTVPGSPTALGAQSAERGVERSIERMAEELAAAAERMAARVEKQATLMATRLEREFARKRNSDPNWRSNDGGSLFDREGAEQQARTSIDTTVAFSSDGSIDLSNIAGEIVVTGWDRREAQIKATSERGRLMLDLASSRLTLEEERRGSSTWGSGRRGETRYEVSVPRGVRVVARSTSGSITVRGTGGAVEASSTSGDVEVTDATRRVEVSSISGDVTARKLRGNVDATSVSGDVDLDDVEGDVRAETTSGDIVLAGVVSRDVEASTTSGEVTFAGDLSNDGRYEFHSHSGTIALTIPASTNARFSVETFSGELDSAFPITLQPGDRSSRRPRRFEFTVGNGGARVIAETFSGDLEIRKR